MNKNNTTMLRGGEEDEEMMRRKRAHASNYHPHILPHHHPHGRFSLASNNSDRDVKARAGGRLDGRTCGEGSGQERGTEEEGAREAVVVRPLTSTQ